MKPYERKAKVTNPASRKRMKKRHYSVRYLKENSAAAKHTEFEHVLAAEYQDINKAEQTAVAYLSETAQICIVGDGDQSIYAFSMRGTKASVSGRISIPAVLILRFPIVKSAQQRLSKLQMQ